MAISIPDTLTADNSGKYIMSIRLRSDGLSFSGYSPSESESFFYRNIEFDRTKPYISSLKEFFFEHEFLTYSYKRTNLVYVSPQYTVVPEEVFTEKQKTDLLSFTFSAPENKCLHNPLAREAAEVVFGMEEEVYEFCSRSLINPAFVHHITPQLVLWKQQSRALIPRQMYVVIHRKMMDVVCFAQGKLLFVNTFGYDKPDDILYYILYVWKQVGMDQEKDQLHIYGGVSLRNSMTTTLRNYIQYISPAEIPSDAYLLGAEVVQAPLDLIALSVCEL
ncbi:MULTISPECIES: DUF3822 family protein [unclassified Parabacteroides]|jgi:hypothetical protein|uniref:DUF3822 family protein n=1 Tax=unclassified Parabacteroides TaxID=2649774 RepID=UPI000EFE5101|nr:DUF3822 family protein [Parabacteroides sp. TM07-1AC]RHU22083.1 DUF3822 family protein [Parabacteroides sp. TM07-1AC]